MKPVAFLLLLALPAAAQESALFPRFSVTGGGYLGNFTTEARIDEEGFEGTEIGFERDLGLEKSTNLQRFAVQWRPFSRHELAASHYASDRSGFENIDREIVFRGTTYPVQAEVATTFAADVWNVTYTYWARKTERNGFGLMLGVSGIDLQASVDARAPNGTVTITQDAGTEVPVAVIGAQGRVAFTDKLLAEASAAALPNVELDVYSGRATMAAARLEYRVARWLGIGAAYNYFRIDGTVEEFDFTGELSLTVQGPEAYVRLAF